jgi:hypothetical protein
MKTGLLLASGIFLAAFAATAISVPAEAKTKKECLAQWKEMKAAKQTADMHYRDFKKKCMAGEAGAPGTPPPAAETKPGPTTTATPAAKPMSPKHKAMLAREHACAADWKADKAAGKIAVGMKWPQYWSDCNKRKKAEGM